MAATSIKPPFEQFTDTNGDPLEAGYIYIGATNQAPESNPISVYWDAALSIAADQPIRTVAGYPSRNGTPAMLYAGADYSIMVKNKNGSIVFSASSILERVSPFQTGVGAVVDSISALRLISKTEFSTAFVLGYYTKGDDGGGEFYYDAADTTSADNGGTIIVAADGGRWKRVDTSNLTVKDFGAVGDNITDDTAAFAAAATASDFVHVPEGTYRIASNLDFDATLVGAGGVLYFENTTVNFNGVIQSAPNPLFTFGANVIFKITEPQDVYADWFLQTGSEEFAIRRAFELSASGSRILLLGKTYTTKAIKWINDPLDATGKDTGKVIEGVFPAQRYKTTGEFFGTRIVLVDGENDNMFTIDSSGVNAYGSGAIKNVMLEGNKSNQTAGSGIEIVEVKDFLLENVYVWGFYDDGINFSGANNQISIEGFIECWNNGRDGIRGAAIGDAQMSGAIRCVNNGRYGFYLAAGRGRYDQIYSYFNAERGVWIGPSVDKGLFINYLLSEDNDKEGVRIDGNNISIDTCVTHDNGVTGATATEKSGLYLSATAENVSIRVLIAVNKTAAAHNQQYLLYDLSANGCSVDKVINEAFGQHGVASEATAVFSNNTSLNGCFVDRRMTLSDTYANVKDAGASITPLPDTYGRYNITAISQNMTVKDSSAERSCEGMVLELALGSSGSYNVTWGADYLDASGSAISATALTAGQTAVARFQQTNGKWYLISPIVIA